MGHPDNLQEYGHAAEVAYQGRVLLRECVVPAGAARHSIGGRAGMALAEESLSPAAHRALDPPVRAFGGDLRPVAALRTAGLAQVRRGGSSSDCCQMSGMSRRNADCGLQWPGRQGDVAERRAALARRDRGGLRQPSPPIQCPRRVARPTRVIWSP